MSTVPRHVLPVLVIARFACTSPGFTVNAVMPDLQREMGWSLAWPGSITSARQFGFIAGMWVFALLAVADRYPARRVFLVCALGGWPPRWVPGPWCVIPRRAAVVRGITAARGSPPFRP